MSNHGDEPELTKAVSLETDATGVIPIASDPETGELGPLDVTKVGGLASGSAFLVVRRGALEGMQFPLMAGELVSIGRSSDSKIFLELHVKVRNNWRNNELYLNEYGYNA
jgi:hypothetical protein